jgi:spiro-SPASM protein
MNNLACVFAGRLTEYARLPLRRASSALELVASFAEGIPGVSRIVYLSGGDTSFPASRLESRIVSRASWTPLSLFEAIRDAAAGFDNVVYFWADTPLLDGALARRMLEAHGKAYAEYTFADGYPVGLAPEFLKVSALPALAALAEKVPGQVERDSVFSVVQKDINSFDLETEISPVDLRLFRANLGCDTRRNYLLTKALVDAGAAGEESASRLIRERQELLRTLPAYASIQIVDSCPQACPICPYPVFGGDPRGRRGEMAPELFDLAVGKIAEFCGDAVIGLSLWGEPSAHSGIVQLAESVLARSELSLLIETSGIGWTPAKLDPILAMDQSRITWIASLDAIEPEVYGKLRGEGFAEAFAFAERMVALRPATAYVQAVRVGDNEESLEKFYRFWKERTENIIIQKYDSCAGLLPDRKVADLSPISRNPCWHLMRDLTVLIDGRVCACREDVRGTKVLGNLLESPLAEVWAAGAPDYLRHVAGDYDSLCKGCDEYYTYNY